MAIQGVVDSFHILTIGFMIIFPHVSEVPDIMTQNNMHFQCHWKIILCMQEPKINLKIKNWFLTSW